MEVEKINNISDFEKILSTNKDFYFELSKEKCPYCKIMDREEEEISFNRSVTIYKFVITDEMSVEQIDEFKKYVEPIKYAPTLYHIKNGETIDYLNIQDWQNSKNEVMDWINNQN